MKKWIGLCCLFLLLAGVLHARDRTFIYSQDTKDANYKLFQIPEKPKVYTEKKQAPPILIEKPKSEKKRRAKKPIQIKGSGTISTANSFADVSQRVRPGGRSRPPVNTGKKPTRKIKSDAVQSFIHMN
jgi:hypothetical protein